MRKPMTEVFISETLGRVLEWDRFLLCVTVAAFLGLGLYGIAATFLGITKRIQRGN